MGAKLYVGNLTVGTTEASLTQLFAPYGTVKAVDILMSRDAGHSRGFGFVEMDNDAEAGAAIAGLNGKSVGGRSLTVTEASPRADWGYYGQGRR